MEPVRDLEVEAQGLQIPVPESTEVLMYRYKIETDPACRETLAQILAMRLRDPG